MKISLTKGKWRFSREYGCITVSPEGIVEGSKTICNLNRNIAFDYCNGNEAIANGLAIAELPELLRLALVNYVGHERKAQVSPEYAIETFQLRSELRQSIARAIDEDEVYLSNWIDHLVQIKDIDINDIKFM
mgnify:CR=1 FL=1|tara:strand:- start:352 stop:747 length:396 start_codon:yes stop_codon:yes gene_type:complete